MSGSPAAIAVNATEYLAIDDAGTPLIWCSPIGALPDTDAVLLGERRHLGRLELVQGWSGPLDVQLVDGQGEPVLLLGCAAAVLVQRPGRSAIEAGAEVLDREAGLVRWRPDPAELPGDEAPYGVRFRVTDADGTVLFFPSRAVLTLFVRRT